MTNNLPAAARGPAPCEDGIRYNSMMLSPMGTRTMNAPSGEIEECYDRIMWPAVDWLTDNAVELKIRNAVAVERERCAKTAETWEMWCGRTGYSAEEYACEDIASKIRKG